MSPHQGKGVCPGSGADGCASVGGGRSVQHLLSPPVCMPRATYERGLQLLAGHHPAYLHCRGFVMRAKATGTGAGYDGYIPTGPGAKEAELS
jgi:hypothetical protein